MSKKKWPGLSTPEAAVAGALLDCIHAHGRITEEGIPSAAKRIYGQLAGLNTEGYWRRRYDHLHQGHKRLLEQVSRMIGRRPEQLAAVPVPPPGRQGCPTRSESDVSDGLPMVPAASNGGVRP